MIRWILLIRAYFCLRKLKSITGYEYDAEVSYERMQVELEDIFRAKWIWPSYRLRCQRMAFFINELRDKPDIVKILTPPVGFLRPRGRPRLRMIDGIAQDLLDIFGMKWQLVNIPPKYSKMKPDYRSIKFDCPSKSYATKAHKIMYLVEKYGSMILDDVKTPWNFTVAKEFLF